MESVEYYCTKKIRQAREKNGFDRKEEKKNYTQKTKMAMFLFA